MGNGALPFNGDRILVWGNKGGGLDNMMAMTMLLDEQVAGRLDDITSRPFHTTEPLQSGTLR